MNPFKHGAFLAACISVLAASPAALAEVVVLTPVADTGLFEFKPTNNMGGFVHVAAGSVGDNAIGFRSRALFRFDLQGQIPSNATIQSATLKLYVIRIPDLGLNVASTFGLHRTLVSWGEGAQFLSSIGNPAATNEATWNRRFWPNVQWSTPGGAADSDYVGQASSTQPVDLHGFYTFPSTSDMVADVTHWLQNPGQNFGWMLISQSEEIRYTARRFSSREDPTATFRPMLTIDFTTASEPSPPLLSALIVSNGMFCFSFTAEAGHAYTVESRASVSSGPWTSLTNIPAPPATTNVVISDPISPGDRFYRVHSP